MVLGDLAGKRKDYEKKAKQYGFEAENFEFLSDYDKITNIGIERLRYSNRYSDIICGPIPHNVRGAASENVITEIKENQDQFPHLHEAKINGKLKLTVSVFEKLIQKTKLYNRVYKYKSNL